jgi:NAD(P)-dependent dehydrogenase (short-subunit alcohol dehydrogenase family)
MRILVIGATGTIGSEVVKTLADGNEIVAVTRSSAPVSVDLGDPASIRAMYAKVGRVDAVVSAAGATAGIKPLAEQGDEDFAYSIANKLMGQVNLVRYGIDHVADGGSFTLTSGVLGRQPMPGVATISLVNLGLEGFAKAAALDLPRGLRVNVVSPPWVDETLRAYAMTGLSGLPAATVARAYAEAVATRASGTVIEPR